MYCCCFGHRGLYANIESELEEVLDKIIQKNDDVVFLTGGMGETDGKFSSCVRRLKRKYPHIRLLLIMPYLTNELNTYKDYYISSFDDIIIPEELMGTYYKSAIGKRNRWMVDHSEIVIDCTYRDYGGAYTAIKYALRKNKKVISIIKK